jgi:anti-sigma regulatory factor (Ser/Thr protein kinase)
MNCGHPAPLVVTPSEGPAGRSEAGPGGVPIGFAIAEPASYRPADEFDWVTPPGSYLFFYSDGLTESRHATTREELGEERLQHLLSRVHRGQRFMSLAAEVCAAVTSAGFNLAGDDCTAISVEIVPPERVLFHRAVPLEREAAIALSKEVEQTLLRWGWADGRAAEIQLVIIEYMTNVIAHGGCPFGSTLVFWMGGGAQTVRLTFRDNGKAWHYGRALKKARKSRLDSPHGRGLRIIARLANQVELTRMGNENVADMLFERVRPMGSESPMKETVGEHLS